MAVESGGSPQGNGNTGATIFRVKHTGRMERAAVDASRRPSKTVGPGTEGLRTAAAKLNDLRKALKRYLPLSAS
jgi:hypothetical protein